MPQITVKVLAIAIVAGLAFLLVIIFRPRQYNAPVLQKRDGTRYWELPTGSRIAYILIPAKGIKKSSPVLYLHGGPGGPIKNSNIESLAALADDGYDVYLYDQIGGGHSGRLADLADYTADRHKRDLEAIIQQIGAEKVIIIGQSWGGILATLFAAANPEKVEKIVFACPGPMQPQARELAAVIPPDSLHLRAPYFSNALGNVQANNLRTKTTAWLATTFRVKLADDVEADNFAAFLNGALNRSLVCDTMNIPIPEGGAGYYVQVMTVQSFLEIQDPRPVLKKAPYPVLVMKGQCDSQKWGYTREYLDVFPQHQLVVIPDAGHAIAIEQPALYIRTIRAFLRNSSAAN